MGIFLITLDESNNYSRHLARLVAQPLQIVAKIQPIHAIMFIVTSSGALLAL